MFRRVVQSGFFILSILGLISVNYTLFVIFLVTSLLLGPFFCGWLCLFGFMQDILSKISKLLKLPTLKIPVKFERVLKFSRYLVFICLFIGFTFAMVLDSPYRVFSGVMSWNFNFISITSWITFTLVILAGLFIDRPFCRYLCTEGARHGVISFLRIFSIRRNNMKCISCKKCDRKCPMQINVSTVGYLRDPQCINCFKCIKSCPVDGCLQYSFLIKGRERG